MSPENHKPRKTTDRFAPRTGSINLQKLERESRRLLYAGVFLGVLLHAALAVVFPSRISHQFIQRHIVVRLIDTRPPRTVIHRPLMTKPFLVNKKLFRKHVLTRKTTNPRIPLIGVERMKQMLLDSITLDDSLETAICEIVSSFEEAALPEVSVFSPAIPFRVGIERISKHTLSLREELLTIEDIEAGLRDRIKGLAIYNPNDKHSLTGIISIPHLWDSSWPPKNMSMGIIGLVEAVNTYTAVIARVDRHLNFYTNRRLRHPFVYIGTTSLWEYNSLDVEAMQSFLDSGGFAVFENLWPVSHTTPAEASLRQFIRDVLGSKARVYPIPEDHPLYHCFFDFDEPPPGAKIYNMDGHLISIPVHYLEGIFIGDRLVGIYSNKAYGRTWRFRECSSQLRMGVNMVVYAMMHAGGKAVKKIDYALKAPADVKLWASYGTGGVSPESTKAQAR